jgi:hypothetical protein
MFYYPLLEITDRGCVPGEAQLNKNRKSFVLSPAVYF